MRGIRVTAAAAVLLLAVSCGGDDGDDEAGGEAGATTAAGEATTTTAAGTSTTRTGSATSVASATTAAPTIGVADFTFKPATVPPGSKVRLANGDSVAHTVESRDGAWTFDEASQTFTAPAAAGTYAIFCGIHASMTGNLTVA